MEIYEVEEKIERLSAGIVNIEVKAANEKRGLNQEELACRAEMQGAITELTKHFPEKPLTVQLDGGTRKSKGYEMLSPDQKKGYVNLFGTQNQVEWTDKDIGFFAAVNSGRHHPDLIKSIKNAMGESVPGDGGFLVPTETASQIHAVSLEDELVMPNAFVQPMLSDEKKLPGFTIGDHSSNLFGGFTASYKPEAGSLTEANPKTREMTLKAKKLTGYIRYSSELAEDADEKQIINICGSGLGWYRDQAFLRGSGSGEPMGILNSPCLASVTKKSGQAANTILYFNLLDMMKSLYAPSFKRSVWVAHQSCIPELLSLSIAVGTGGSVVPVMSQTDGKFSILTRPVIFTEKMNELGETGDIGLFDFSQYVVGLRGGMRVQTSIDVLFTTDELVTRLIERHDGFPLWNEKLTLRDGSTEVSPFVVIEAR